MQTCQALWYAGGGKGRMHEQQYSSSSPSLLHDLPAPWDPSPRQEPAHGARSWESWLGIPGTQVGVDGMLAAWVPVLLGAGGGGGREGSSEPSPCCPLGSELASHFSPQDPSSTPWPVLEPRSGGPPSLSEASIPLVSEEGPLPSGHQHSPVPPLSSRRPGTLSTQPPRSRPGNLLAAHAPCSPGAALLE